MAVTVIGGRPSATGIPPVSAPVISVKQEWSFAWQQDPTLRLDGMSLHVAGLGLDELSVRRTYGQIQEPWELGGSSTRAPIDLIGWWIQVKFINDQGISEPIWVGRISSDRRGLLGEDVKDAQAMPVRTGVQTFLAHGALQILRKTHVSRSWWIRPIGSGNPPPIVEQDLGWLPNINGRDDRGLTVGNRSANKYLNGTVDAVNGVYLYGGTELWSHYDYLEYILARFVDNGVGPSWSIGGQADILKNITDTIKLRSSMTVAQIIRKLIPIELGLDYKIVPIPQSPSPGFEIFVFALTGDQQTFGTGTMPKNPNTVNVNVADFDDGITATVVQSLDQQFDRINVIGGRIVVCCSLRGGNINSSLSTLVSKWDRFRLEVEYQQGGGPVTTPVDVLDKNRLQEKFRPVYQEYGAPEDWDHQSGQAAPFFDDSGVFDAGQTDHFQNLRRRTLPELPLFSGFDYTVSPPVDNNPFGHQPGLLPPQVWLFDEAPEDGGNPRYIAAEKAGIHVRNHGTDWGVLLTATPNHLLALNHFDADVTPSLIEPKYDFEKMIATIAFETDQRLTLHFELVSGTAAFGEQINIEVPDAEVWILAPNTVVDIDNNGQLVEGLAGILRSDHARLWMVMAGAIARYNLQRNRAEVSVKGLRPFSSLLGQILETVEQGGNTQNIRAPISSIEFSPGDEARTILKTGFAR